MANHLTELRKNNGNLSVKEVAETLCISKGMVYQMEEGHKKPSSELAIKIARLFNCSLDEIYLPYEHHQIVRLTD